MRWSPALSHLDWLTARPIAHRGLHDAKRGVIENTESAFAAGERHEPSSPTIAQISPPAP